MAAGAAKEWAQRARSFGAVARQYDRARPSYPNALVDDVVCELPGRELLEVGAGTGKATTLFGVRPVRITCIEPDAEMATVLRENCADLPNVSVCVASFEEWQPVIPYDGLIAGQSWHWTKPRQRYRKAASALREGGVLALFWNHLEWHRTPIAAAIDEVYRRHGKPKATAEAGAYRSPDPWPRSEIEKEHAFTAIEVRSYRSRQNYTAHEWCDYVASTSDHLILPPGRSEALLADVRRVIEHEAAGVLEVHRRCDLYLARRTAAPADRS